MSKCVARVVSIILIILLLMPSFTYLFAETGPNAVIQTNNSQSSVQSEKSHVNKHTQTHDNLMATEVPDTTSDPKSTRKPTPDRNFAENTQTSDSISKVNTHTYYPSASWNTTHGKSSPPPSSTLSPTSPNPESTFNSQSPGIGGTDVQGTIDLSKPLIALTFDDGPYSPVTNEILDLIEKYKIKATFFVVGSNLEKSETSRKSLARADSLGCEIGNHTYNHKDLSKLSKADIVKQISKTNSIINSVISKSPALVRPPYGKNSKPVLSNIDMPLMYWSVDTEDWKSRNAQAIVNRVMGQIKDGDIILMHDIYPSTAEACKIIIPQLIEQGYQFVTASELFAYKGIQLKLHREYRSAK